MKTDLLPGATATLRERLLGKIVMPGPATPCATWVGVYNSVGRRAPAKHTRHHRRPQIRLGGRTTRMVYVAPTMLRIAGVVPDRDEQVQACHCGCPTGPAWHGVYSCVDLAHLRWGSQAENERDKRRMVDQ